MVHHGIDLEALSPQEQLDLLDQLWERLGRSPDLFPLTDEQRRELDVRSDELDRDLSAGLLESDLVGEREGERTRSPNL